MKNSTIKALLWFGLIASVLVGIGEYMLHFLPGGPGGEVAMLEDVPLGRASTGHFFAVIGAPLYFAGYYGLKELFKRSNVKLANLLFILGVLAFFVGGIWISSRYLGAVILQKSNGSPNHDYFLQQYEDHYQILVWALRIVVLSLSAVYVMLILKNKQNFPKWMAIVNPIVLLIIILSSLIWFNPLGIHVAPIAMNVTHFIFFGLILYQFSKHQNQSVAL